MLTKIGMKNVVLRNCIFLLCFKCLKKTTSSSAAGASADAKEIVKRRLKLNQFGICVIRENISVICYYNFQ